MKRLYRYILCGLIVPLYIMPAPAQPAPDAKTSERKKKTERFKFVRTKK